MTERSVAVITGAGGGLGRVLAADLALDGYDLALVGTDPGRLEALRGDLGLDATHAFTVVANLRDREAAASAIDKVYERFGHVDALAHLVGGWTGGMTVARSPDEPYASMIDQHIWTPLNVTRELAPRMAEAGFGRIVAVSSPMAVEPQAGMSAYAIGKAGLEALFKTLASEVGDNGVTVNVVRVRTIDPSSDRTVGSTQGHATTAAEISAAIRYLFSPEARVINGRDPAAPAGLASLARCRAHRWPQLGIHALAAQRQIPTLMQLGPARMTRVQRVLAASREPLTAFAVERQCQVA